MLTKQDLGAIGKLVDTKLDLKLTPMHGDIKVIKKDVKKLQKDLKIVATTLDKDIIRTQKRVSRIERHLHLEEMNFA